MSDSTELSYLQFDWMFFNNGEQIKQSLSRIQTMCLNSSTQVLHQKFLMKSIACDIVNKTHKASLFWFCEEQSSRIYTNVACLTKCEWQAFFDNFCTIHARNQSFPILYFLPCFFVTKFIVLVTKVGVWENTVINYILNIICLTRHTRRKSILHFKFVTSIL